MAINSNPIESGSDRASTRGGIFDFVVGQPKGSSILSKIYSPMYTTRISRHIIDEEFHSFSLNVNVLLFLAKKRLNKNENSQELT